MDTMEAAATASRLDRLIKRAGDRLAEITTVAGNGELDHADRVWLAARLRALAERAEDTARDIAA